MTITEPTEAATVPIAGDDDEPRTATPSVESGGDTGEPAETAVTAPEPVTAEATPAETVAADPPAAEAVAEPVDDVASEPTPEAAALDDLEEAATQPSAPKAPRAPRGPRGERSGQQRRPSPPGGRDRRTTAQRLGNFPRADKPATIPTPEHHHLPGWVRRDFARARPPLSNILALLEGEVHEQFARRIAELTEGISSGKFSLAWQYPDLVDEGRTLYEKQRRESAETARANRQLDGARRRVQDRIRDAGDSLPAEVGARLQRQLRSAGDAGAIAAVGNELDGVLSTARSSADKRREREIERTRARIRRSAAAAGVTATAEAPATETWQDVLRRFAEEQAAAGRSSE